MSAESDDLCFYIPTTLFISCLLDHEIRVFNDNLSTGERATMDPSIMIIAMIVVLGVIVILVSIFIFLVNRSRNNIRQQAVPPVEMQRLNPNAGEAQVDNQAFLQRPTPTATPHPPPEPGATAPLLPQIPHDSGRAAEEDAATPENPVHELSPRERDIAHSEAVSQSDPTPTRASLQPEPAPDATQLSVEETNDQQSAAAPEDQRYNEVTLANSLNPAEPDRDTEILYTRHS